MNKPITKQLNFALKRLENAHGDLIEARKQAALEKHESYAHIGLSISALENTIESIFLTKDMMENKKQ